VYNCGNSGIFEHQRERNRCKDCGAAASASIRERGASAETAVAAAFSNTSKRGKSLKTLLELTRGQSHNISTVSSSAIDPIVPLNSYKQPILNASSTPLKCGMRFKLLLPPYSQALAWSKQISLTSLTLHSLCAASRMWVRHQSLLIVPPEGGLEFSAGLTTKIVFQSLFMSRLKVVSGLPYKIVLESWNTHASSSARPYESCKIFKGRPRRNAFSKLVHHQYKSFPTDRFCQVEIQNTTGLSNKPSTA